MSYKKSHTDILQEVNKKIMNFPPIGSINANSHAHDGLNSFFLQMRQEIHCLQKVHTRTRAEKLRKVFIQDFLEEEKELNEVGLSYMNTQL